MKTQLVMLTEHSPFMMSFVYLTSAGRAVVIDGGRAEDMPWLFEEVGDRPIAAWILTHPHLDHIGGFIDVVASHRRDAQIEKVYYNFPSVEFAMRCDPDEATREDFARVEPLIADKRVCAEPGMTIRVDELTIDFLFCGGERHEWPKPNLAVNESSIAFRVTRPDCARRCFWAISARRADASCCATAATGCLRTSFRWRTTVIPA